MWRSWLRVNRMGQAGACSVVPRSGRRSKSQRRRRKASGGRRRLGRRPQPGSPSSARLHTMLELAGPRRRKRVLGRRGAGSRRGGGPRREAHLTVDRLSGPGRLFAAIRARCVRCGADVQCRRAAGDQARLVAGADLREPELGQQRQQRQSSGQARRWEAAATGCHGRQLSTARKRLSGLAPTLATVFACFARRRHRSCIARVAITASGIRHRACKSLPVAATRISGPRPWTPRRPRNVWPARHPRLGKIKNSKRDPGRRRGGQGSGPLIRRCAMGSSEFERTLGGSLDRMQHRPPVRSRNDR